MVGGRWPVVGGWWVGGWRVMAGERSLQEALGPFVRDLEPALPTLLAPRLLGQWASHTRRLPPVNRARQLA